MIINNFGEEHCAENSDWDDHHDGERSDNGDYDGLNKTDLASDHTHAEEHANDEAYADNDEDHPEMLDEPSADHDRDPVDYGEEDHSSHDGNQGQDCYEPEDSYHQDYDCDGHDNQEPPDYHDQISNLLINSTYLTNQASWKT